MLKTMALDKINSGVKQVAPRAANREACVDGGGLTQLLVRMLLPSSSPSPPLVAMTMNCFLSLF